MNVLQLLRDIGIDIVIYLWVFYALYVFTMGVYRAKLSGRLCGLSLVLLYPFVIVAVLADIFCQLTIASLLFLQLPSTRWEHTKLKIFGHEFNVTYLHIELLVTKRLQRYHRGDYGWRTVVAAYICANLLDPFDPEGKHC